jgi:hypothetical protein
LPLPPASRLLIPRERLTLPLEMPRERSEPRLSMEGLSEARLPMLGREDGA